MLPTLTVNLPARPRQFSFREGDVLTVDLMQLRAAARFLRCGGDDDQDGEATYTRCGETDYTRCGEATYTRCGEATYRKCG